MTNRFSYFGVLAVCLTLLSVSCCLSVAQPPLPRRPGKPKPAPKPPLRKGRETQSLNGVWRMRAETSGGGEKAGWTKALPEGTQEVTVPFLAVGKPRGASSVIWCWREFVVPAWWRGQTVRLHFGAGAKRTDIWMNGVSTGKHAGATTTFAFDITKSIHLDGTNLLAVRLEGGERPPALWQSVGLMAHDEAFLEDAFPQGSKNGNLTVALELRNTSDKSGVATLYARISPLNSPKTVLGESHQNLDITPGRNVSTLLASLKRKQVRLWSPDSPTLYQLNLRFQQEDDILDTLDIPFGFRDLDYQNGSLTLNETSMTLKAHLFALDPPIILAGDTERVVARELLRRERDKGYSLLYVEAPDLELLSLADEVGILVVVGPSPGLSPQAALAELSSLVVRDRAHPSVIAWDLRTVGENSSDALATLHKLDPTRFLLFTTMAGPKLALPELLDSRIVSVPAGFLPTR